MDQLDISDLLLGYDSATDNIEEFLQFTNSGSDTLVQVDADGTAGGSNYVTIAQLNDITDVNVQAMLENQNIIA